MANKALATRQKMRLRVEPSQTTIPSKPRNPVAVAAKQRAAGPHAKNTAQERLLARVLLKKAKLVADEDE